VAGKADAIVEIVRERRHLWQRQRSLAAPLTLGRPARLTGDVIDRAVQEARGEREISEGVIVGQPASAGRMTQPYLPSRLRRNFGSDTLSAREPPELTIGEQDGDEWSMQLDLPVVQAGRSIPAREALPLQAMNDAFIVVTAIVYSSAAPPFTVDIPLQIRVELQEMKYLDLLEELERAAAAELRQ
jgi:hypothetical protein